MSKRHEVQALMDILRLVGGDAKSIRLPLVPEQFKEATKYVSRYRKSEDRLWAILLAALVALRKLHEATGRRMLIDHFADPRPN